jgi:TonB family protein
MEVVMTRRARRLACGALVVLCLAAPMSNSAQSQTAPPRSEQQLLAVIGADPSSLGPYLELVQLYADQRRFDEAKAMLARATQVIDERRASLATAAAPVTQQPGRVNGGITPPRLIKRVEAQYPSEAKAAGIQGLVYLQITIGTDGKVADVEVRQSPSDLLSDAAMKAVRQWIYQPTLLNGVAVPVTLTVTVNFKL